MAWQILTEIAGISISYLSGISSPPTDNVQADVLVLGQNSSAWQRSDGYGTKTWNIDNKLQINTSISSSQRTTYCASIETSHVFMNATGGGGSSVKRADTCFWIDDVNERAYCVGAFATDYGNTWILYPSISVAYQQELYQIIKGLIPPQYNWQSVPSISGKNGILSLAQIKEDYINEGESVSGASSDHFTNLSTENRVDVLIDDALPAPEIGGTTVTVKYTIPSLSTGSYEYCKLVAKKNSMPEGPEDGDKIVDIDPTTVSVSVKNLKGHTKYYFVIFIKDADGNESSSNTKSITTQGAVIPEEYQQYLDLLALTDWGVDSGQTLLVYANRRGNSSTSIVSSDHSFITSGNFNANQYNYGFSVLELSTINISTDPVTVLYTCNVAEYDIIKTSGRDMWGVYSENGNGADYIQTWGSITGVSSPGNTDGLRFNPTTSFNSLGDCLAYLAQHFRHVNIKVDGEYWLKLD